MKTEQAYSNRVTTCVLEGVREIVGPDVLETVVHNADLDYLMTPEGAALRPSVIRLLHSVCLNQYGAMPVEGIARQSGRSFFNYFLKLYGKEAGFEEMEFRLLPPRKRILVGLESLAAVVSRECGCPAVVASQEDKWTWKMSRLPGIGKGLKTQRQFIQGVLQGYLSWISGGRYYPVDEMPDAGDEDSEFVIEIAQQPLD